MAEVLVRDIRGDVIQRGRNLAVIVGRSRVVPPQRVDAYLYTAPETADGALGSLGVIWSDGSFCQVDFASAVVLRNYVERARWKRNAKVCFHIKD